MPNLMPNLKIIPLNCRRAREKLVQHTFHIATCLQMQMPRPMKSLHLSFIGVISFICDCRSMLQPLFNRLNASVVHNPPTGIPPQSIPHLTTS